MIRRLRNRFIRIATLSVAAVMLLLTVILNTANFISTDGDLRDTLTLIQENEGPSPSPPTQAAPLRPQTRIPVQRQTRLATRPAQPPATPSLPRTRARPRPTRPRAPVPMTGPGGPSPPRPPTPPAISSCAMGTTGS